MKIIFIDHITKIREIRMETYKYKGKEYELIVTGNMRCEGCCFYGPYGECQVHGEDNMENICINNNGIFKEVPSKGENNTGTWADDVEMRATVDGLPIVEVQYGPAVCILKAYISATEAVVEMENGEATVVKINRIKYLRK